MPGRIRSLREWRARQVWTIRDLATAAGVSTRTVVQAEAGAVAPHPLTIRKIAAALGVEPMQVKEFRAALRRRASRGKDAA
jgi:transcriptional regulator with XRE-family HTH domain